MTESVPFQSWPPSAGLYKTRLVKDGPYVPVRIWFGPPVIGGEVMDRAPRWNIEVNGRTDRWEKDDTGYRCLVPLDVEQYWPFVARLPITPADYDHMKRVVSWANEHAPHHPKASPRTPVDFHTLPPRF